MTDYADLLRDLRTPTSDRAWDEISVQHLRSAADAIEALQAECERLRAELAAAQSTIKLQEGMLDDRDALAEKLDAAEIDAARYRWLRDNHETGKRASWIVFVVAAESWDAAIDAAMAQEKRDDQ